MQKKYIIGVVVGILIWGGFMFYRHHKKGEGNDQHRQKLNAQLVEMAKKSPRAGMAHIGEALSQYHKDHNTYPEKLMDLYPKYLDSESLITEIDWYYEPRGDNFYLSKTVVVRNKRMVAHMDNSLRPTSDKGVMVAAPTPPPSTEAAIEEDIPEETVYIPEEKRLAMARENFLKALREGRFSVTAVSEPGEDEQRLIAKVMPQVLSVSDQTGASSPEMELAHQFLIWKGDGGGLGFGNTQYPATEDLSIFTYGRWYHLHMPKEEPTREKDGDTGGEKTHWSEMVLASLSQGSIGWKDKSGTYGFGDTQYPAKGHLSVFENDRWVAMPHTPLPPNTDPQRAHGTRAQSDGKRPTEHIASEMATQWLVWKDKSGTYGFGDHQYPENHAATIFQGDQWVPYERQTTAPGTESAKQDQHEMHGAGIDVVARFGSQHLIWKDKNGTLGFGNLQYPKSGLASVYQSDEWIEAETLQRTEKTISGDNKTPGKETASRGKKAILDGPYLVWKTTHGTLGFGNHQYPSGNGVSHIHVDGSWRPVAN